MARFGRWNDDERMWFPPSRPRAAKYGIRTTKQHGRIGETWWSQRWIHALEMLDMGPRLARGRSYARRGQVLDLQVAPGCVTARVQGSRPTPYSVEIRLHAFSHEEWNTVIATLATQALFAAKLLAGEMPHEIEAAFDTARLPLFPSAINDLATKCSCPDWANPCKHIAAVYYLLADTFDKDPFLLFTLRGRNKDDVLRALRDVRAAHGEPAHAALPDASQPAAPDDWLADFWRPGDDLLAFTIRPARPPAHMAVLARLGNGPFTELKPADALSAAYDIMSTAALDAAHS